MGSAPQTAVLITGPTWWGHRFIGRDGNPVPAKGGRLLREQRTAEAPHETHGLQLALGNLPETCVLVLPATRGAARQAATWASQHDRQTVIVPAIDEGSWQLAVDVLTGLAAVGYRCKALVCAAEPRLVVPELDVVKVWYGPVLPVDPTPAPAPDVLDQPAAVC